MTICILILLLLKTKIKNAPQFYLIKFQSTDIM